MDRVHLSFTYDIIFRVEEFSDFRPHGILEMPFSDIYREFVQIETKIEKLFAQFVFNRVGSKCASMFRKGTKVEQILILYHKVFEISELI